MEPRGDILYGVEDHVATITFNRPDRMNALGGTLTRDLNRGLQDADADPEVRCVILTGAGRGFCAGMDLKERSGNGIGGRCWTERLRGLQAPRTVLRMTTPVIAAVNGPAVGAGMEYALLCDYRIGSENARMADNHVKRGLTGDVAGALTIPRLVVWANACKIMLTGDFFDAQELLEMGVLDMVVPASELMDAARDFARRIAANAPLGVRMTKRLMHQGGPAPLDDLQDYSLLVTGVMQQTDDFKESVQAFAEQREARFEGG